MPTRHPHIPNVKLADFFSQSTSFRSLVQVAASEPFQGRTATLNIPTAFFTPKITNTPTLILPTNLQFYPGTTKNMETNILSVDPQKLGNITFKNSNTDLIDEWDIQYTDGKDYESLKRAAEELVNTDTPVAFPTETVYGLGADATRSAAVKAIFAAKGRPSDNPLIVHIHSLPQLRALLSGKKEVTGGLEVASDPIPEIYRPLIERFWPGPLTIILPAPRNSILAPEVTAGLPTFGARMPRSILALALLRLCGRPLAGPSANASTRPSPTAAEHVFDDLQGRIHTIIDGGPCEVGVESTVVDGLSTPPSILRPGGVTVEQLRQCPGWENVTVGYKDKQEGGAGKPRAPGMKYRHYSPKAEVVLFEAGAGKPADKEIKSKRKIGVIRTKGWRPVLDLDAERLGPTQTNGHIHGTSRPTTTPTSPSDAPSRISNLLRSVIQHQVPHAEQYMLKSDAIEIWDIDLGAETEGVARGLFSALRELDKKGVDIIYVEGISDQTGDDIAAAVMNRLRKAAEIRG
ncbi:translation initiation protein Sua5 [Dothidotthia symphoricarpi CBS 119687]|uniref:Threonylcarbamoyl-AMP synthase n=1 Tax=Dothidotthia symphoricarpi CBS 119687 TaxID=1392245 RepID=A0A6A6AWC6_9PLEO|nr:translation initiation protein Sua5 [Dothidotthia symphoricarpi CBS 119687]KAF2134821.1 translation initiation protein Sua5 [Dothidotthia symphoricarpi CBS 119687]